MPVSGARASCGDSYSVLATQLARVRRTFFLSAGDVVTRKKHAFDAVSLVFGWKLSASSGVVNECSRLNLVDIRPATSEKESLFQRCSETRRRKPLGFLDTMIYATPVGSPGPGESATWQSTGFAAYSASPMPLGESSYRTLLDPDLQVASFAGSRILDPLTDDDWWESAYGIFLVGVSAHAGPEKPCIGERRSAAIADGFDYTTYAQVDETVRALGSGLADLMRKDGIKLETFPDEERNDGKFANVGILLQSRKEWLFTDLAVSAYPPLTSVTLHYTFPAEHVKSIAEQSKLSCIVTDVDKLKLLAELKPSLGELKTIVVMSARSPLDPPEELDLSGEKKEFAALGVELLSFDEVIDIGRKHPTRPVVKQDPERVFTIVYTSGTTGNPKGVMLTNRNWVAVIRALHIQNRTTLGITPDFVHICYLPLSHVFERVIEYAALAHGVRIAFFSRKRELIPDDWRAAQPSLVLMVPKLATTLLEKIEARLNAQPLVKRLLVGFAVSRKLRSPSKGSQPSFLYDAVLGGSRIMRERIFGSADNMKFAACGGGKLDPAVQQKLEKYLGLNIIQGWGMTETAGAGSWQAYRGDDAYDSVGGPTACMEVKVRSWESYDATRAERPQGELLVRGDNIFAGYFRQKELTAESLVFDDGVGGSGKKPWLLTGDVVEIQPNGSMNIIDRKKSLIKLAQGEYLQTEKLEGIYGASAFVDNIFVHGYDSQSYPVAVVVPNRQKVLAWARTAYGRRAEAERESAAQSDETLFKTALADFELKKEVLADFDQLAREADLLGFEKVKNVFLTADVWTPENGMLTPTFKSKRTLLVRKYTPEIDELYRQLVNKQFVADVNSAVALRDAPWWSRFLLPWLRSWWS
ncbi:AMP-binding enzyme domain-containing protein [Toxoplasma gondii ME49]|uniref:AMP-binding enzyme domain-containing protein n=4 Tax=Toxoplasma gondii TaxID=5811 RepID=B6KA83_TOXGV|nr:AMP-binding enzyme domain-containing protein [Toxoplasma gondii ME49]ESS34825.1 AMP-binding enzyme domain-containing protein [Toxoplasma gondii VEG]KYF47593.1 AMP-binding enzyme domain-containing protein [Toxoplasma gondii ARI]PIL98182.1 AMP-binding enzyme domain-containing protein [Toxoplasma gondii COUG]EPT26220.1 AMP-binding enzyme domain-containing protein [Toxoplasma gondii ME49]CEL77315.1 TPA: long-chain-fatty-acid-CoA ligase, putative [Toxoplasma gondii VEG]|eukprot:XP_002364261.1 AMP-binding enzyme domain-containing protein [Toxoplasma gondii ME49]